MNQTSTYQRLVLFLLSFFLVAALSAQTNLKINPNAAQDIAMIKSYGQAIMKGDFDKVRALSMEGMKSYGPSIRDSATVEKIIADWTQARKDYTDMKVDWIGNGVSVIVTAGPFEGTHVYLWGVWSATQKATSKRISTSFQNTFLLRDNKIVFLAEYRDKLDLLQQLGFTLKAPED